MRENSMKNYFIQYQHNVTSQWGEDGIIEEIFKRIGVKNSYCVEFGAGKGTELSNVWNLISNKKWKAVLIEPNPDSFKIWEDIAKPYDKAIVLINVFVTLEKGKTLEDILFSYHVPSDLDILSIDIDSNDYHIFKNIKKLKPRLILLEHNPTIPPPIELFQSYNEMPPFGSSLSANVKLAHEKGYKLATATITNGFYIREDEFSKLGIEEPRPEDVFDDEAVTWIFSAYNGTLYMYSRQEAPGYKYTRLFESCNIVLTRGSTHSIVTGVGYNQRDFSETLSKKAKPVKVLLDGKGNTTGLYGFISNIVKFIIKERR